MIAIVAVLAVAGAVIGIVLATTGKTKHDADRSGAPTTSGSSNRDPSGGSAGGGPGGSSGGGAGAAPSESDARAVVDRYLADVNKPDKADAARLVCSAAKPDWDRSVDGPGGDFTVVLTHFEFRTSKAGSQPSSIDVVYLIAAAARADGSQHKTKDVTFTVVNEGGPRICGER